MYVYCHDGKEGKQKGNHQQICESDDSLWSKDAFYACLNSDYLSIAKSLILPDIPKSASSSYIYFLQVGFMPD